MTASETTPVDDLEILCERKPSPAKLEVLGIDHWPIWRKDVSEFPWRYDQPETCYILRGRFTVTPQGGVAAGVQPRRSDHLPRRSDLRLEGPGAGGEALPPRLRAPHPWAFMLPSW